jgi:NtrC-family two-component system sensor histidine kinase KinB
MILKTKLSWGLGFLFLIIFTLALFCSYYVGRLGQEADNILKDNYNSIVYARNMLSGLDDMRSSISSVMHDARHAGKMSDYYLKLFESGKNLFETNLKAENSNITELHEKEYVERLNSNYEIFLKLCLQMKDGSGGSSVYLSDFLPAWEKLKHSIASIYDVNMQAVVRKTELTKRDATRFTTSMAIIGSLCLLLAVGYFWYFPLYIATTLSYLSEKMKNLLKNSGITFETKTNDEAQIILQAINLLENNLGVKKENRKSE